MGVHLGLIKPKYTNTKPVMHKDGNQPNKNIAIWAPKQNRDAVGNIKRILQANHHSVSYLIDEDPLVEANKKYYDHIIVLLSIASVAESQCIELISTLTKEENNANAIIPVWLDSKADIPDNYHCVAMLFYSAQTQIPFEQELQAVISRTTHSLYADSQYSPKDFVEAEKNPCIQIEQAEEHLAIYQPFWNPLLYIFVCMGICFAMYTEPSAVTQTSAATQNSGANPIPGFLIIFCLIKLSEIWFPPLVALLTPQYFYIRSGAQVKENALEIKNWLAIPVSEISHFSATDFSKPQRWQLGKIRLKLFADHNCADKSISLRSWRLLLDERYIADVLNGQLMHYRSVFHHFAPHSQYPTKQYRRELHRFKAAFANFSSGRWFFTDILLNLLLIPLQLYAIIKEFFVSNWKKRLWYGPVALVSIAWVIASTVLLVAFSMFPAVIIYEIFAGYYNYALSTLPFVVLVNVLLLIVWLLSKRFKRKNKTLVTLLATQAKQQTQTLSSLLLSYKHEDSSVALKLANALKGLDVNVWIDRFELMPGDNWLEKVEQGLATNDVIGVLLSKQSIESPFVQQELKMALNLKGDRLKILPILLEDVVVPQFLSAYQLIDLREQNNYATQMQQIVLRLKATTEPTPSTNINQTQANEPSKPLSEDEFNGQWQAQRLKYLAPSNSATKIHESANWYWFKCLIALLCVGMLETLWFYLAFPQTKLNGTATEDFLPPLMDLNGINDLHIYLVGIIVFFISLRLFWPIHKIEFNNNSVQIGKKVIRLATVSHFSSNGFWLYPHYYKSDGDSDPNLPNRIAAFTALGQMDQLVMTLNGHLVTMRQMEHAHDCLGKSLLHKSIPERFQRKLVQRRFNKDQTQTTKALAADLIFNGIIAGLIIVTLALSLAQYSFLYGISLYLQFFLILLAIFSCMSLTAGFVIILFKLYIGVMLVLVIILLSASVLVGLFTWDLNKGKNFFDQGMNWVEVTFTHKSPEDDLETEIRPQPDEQSVHQLSPKAEATVEFISGHIRFKQNSVMVELRSANNEVVSLNSNTTYIESLQRLGKPTLTTLEDTDEHKLYYSNTGLALTFFRLRLSQLNIHPTGDKLTLENIDTAKQDKILTWQTTTTWHLNHYPIEQLSQKPDRHKLLQHRDKLPNAYLLKTSPNWKLAECHYTSSLHPSRDGCEVVELQWTEQDKAVTHIDF